MALPRELLLFICVSGVYGCYMVYALLQERVTKQGFGPEKERFKYPIFLLTVQCMVNLLFAVFTGLFRAKGKFVSPFKFLFVSVAYITAMFASNYSLMYIDYPTQVLAKSCKMITVMLGGVIFLKKRYSIKEYLAVVAITVGIAAFFLKKNPWGAESKYSASAFDTAALIGGACVLTSLIMDSGVGTLQEWLRAEDKPTDNQFMTYMNLWSVLILCAGLLVTGEGNTAVAFCQRHNEVVLEIFMFSVCSAFGQFFIFLMMTNFGPLVVSIATTTRKFFTILASVLYFGHDLTPLQWFGVAGVFSGLSMNIYSRYTKKVTYETVKKD